MGLALYLENRHRIGSADLLAKHLHNLLDPLFSHIELLDLSKEFFEFERRLGKGSAISFCIVIVVIHNLTHTDILLP